MISHARFAKLRLARFRPDAEIAELAGWEFMNCLWVGEAIGFSEWLRLESDPAVLRSLALDFKEFPEPAAAAVLEAIGLPIRAGMRLEELRQVLGEPIQECQYGRDRLTYKFTVVGPPKYSASCTVLNKGGLTYLVVMRPLPGKYAEPSAAADRGRD